MQHAAETLEKERKGGDEPHSGEGRVGVAVFEGARHDTGTAAFAEPEGELAAREKRDQPVERIRETRIHENL
ncbi:MAG TPA: hypothetical protein EYQ54_09590 [Myxococcales bacterium]|nr:hypothetical protein [Myxococcales bacterium]